MSDRPAQLPQPTTEWRRSSRSTGMNNCVETALIAPGRLAVRDSKDTELPHLSLSSAAWTSFVTSLRGRRGPGGRVGGLD
ncbi:DUF397 domain-containing protein [Streptomyces sp. NPDC001822]|uniref:DUF397 domain-containing protein n=1 Tax=Streptomyces sp. NPDC001822 TaxID=3364614 RepID=UPI00369EF3D5